MNDEMKLIIGGKKKVERIRDVISRNCQYVKTAVVIYILCRCAGVLEIRCADIKLLIGSVKTEEGCAGVQFWEMQGHNMDLICGKSKCVLYVQADTVARIPLCLLFFLFLFFLVFVCMLFCGSLSLAQPTLIFFSLWVACLPVSLCQWLFRTRFFYAGDLDSPFTVIDQ